MAKIYRRRVKLLPVYQRYYINEEAFNNSNKIFSKNVDRYLDGYWQSEKYFKQIELSIRNEFTLKNELKGRAKKNLSQIIEANSVAIHIRKLHSVLADGKISEKALKIFANVSINYYYESIKYLSVKTIKPQYFIFSDNPEWPKSNIKIPYPTTIVSGFEDYEDLILMSKCKHQIIANSTFSWWGAWLNKNPDKIVIAPEKWVVDDNDYQAQIPESWLRFKNTGN